MKAHYKDTLEIYFNKIKEVKTNLLMTQNCMIDEDGYTDDMDALFEEIDIALENAKEFIEKLEDEVSGNN